MQRFITGLIVLSVAAAGAVFLTTLVHAVYYAPDTEIIPPPGLAAAAFSVPNAAKPVRLSIPAISVDAKVQYVGVNARGNMMVPSNFTDAAWYKYGPAPGQKGSAVIDGHVDNGLGLAGVFKHLGDIKRGDDVYITDQKGRSLHFVVDDIQIYPYDASPAGLIFGRIDAARLNLITCTGTWVSGKRTYNERLVIYTKLASS